MSGERRETLAHREGGGRPGNCRRADAAVDAATTTLCGDETLTLDGSGSALTDCGGTSHEWPSSHSVDSAAAPWLNAHLQKTITSVCTMAG